MKLSMYSHFARLVKANGFLSAARTAKALGFDGIEILDDIYCPPLISSLEEAKEDREILDSLGLVTSCYSVGATLFETPEAVETLRYHAEIASVLGSPFFHHTLHCDLKPLTEEDPDYETVLADTLPRAREVARIADELGLVCLYEPQGMYFNSNNNLGRFYLEMKRSCPNVGLCGDTSNSYFSDEDPAAFYRVFAREFRHVHICDLTVQDEAPEDPKGWYRSQGGRYMANVGVGKGNVPFKELFSILKKAKYKGFLSLETEVPYAEEFIPGIDTVRQLARKL